MKTEKVTSVWRTNVEEFSSLWEAGVHKVKDFWKNQAMETKKACKDILMSLNAEWEKCWIICEGAVAPEPSQLQEDNKKLSQLIAEQDAQASNCPSQRGQGQERQERE